MELIALREPIYLWGEAGSGKSSAAYEASKILNLPFYYLGLQAQVPESRLMGHVSPTTGNYIESEFYKAYTRGGIFLLDELELGNGNLLGSLNGALANGKASFPCGTTDRHPDFICIATGNTPALGASVAYSDRRALDGSVRDRYIFVEWNTDATLEHKLAARHFEQSDKWVNWIQAVRVSAKRVSPKLVITQRASIVGSKLLATGKDVSKVAEMMVWRGFDRPAVNSLLASHPLPIF
jgi:MoxR-like ATPase